MNLLHRLPVVRTLHARGLLAPTLLAGAVGAVLVFGAIERDPPSTEIDAVAEMGPPLIAPRPAFRPELEKTPLTYQGDYWRQIGRRAAEHVVLLGDSREPAIVVAPGLALTSIRVADELARSEQLRDATTRDPDVTKIRSQPIEPPGPDGPRLVGVDVVRQLALFALDAGQAVLPFGAADASTLGAGTFVAAVTLGPRGELRITPGHLASAPPSSVAIDGFDVAIPFPPSTTAAAIINLDGQLLGLAVETGDGIRAMPARTAVETARRLQAGLRCQALSVADLDDTAGHLLGASGGVVVEDVLALAFPFGQPVHEGDVLVEWNGHPVGSAKEFAALYAATGTGQPVTVRLLREHRRVSGELRMPRPDCRPAPEPLEQFPVLGFTGAWVESDRAAGSGGWEVAAVRPGSPAEAAGLERGDVIVAVNGRALVPGEARAPFDRFERRPQPTVLAVRRQDRAKLLTVREPSHD